jgi:hypothetical protein
VFTPPRPLPFVTNRPTDPLRSFSSSLFHIPPTVQNTGGEKQPGVRPIELYMCSVIKRMGYADGFKWLAQFL